MSVRALLALAVLSTGCSADKATQEDAATAPAAVSLYPPVAGQGITLEVDLDATRSVFEFGTSALDLGAGVDVLSIEEDDGWSARATVTIAPDAELGPRDVVIESGGTTYTIEQGFSVIAESMEISPSAVRIGETVEIDVLGHNTSWQGGVTWPSFGDGVEVNEFTVLSETLAVANVSVAPETSPGWRNVVMDNGGGDLVTLYDGLRVDRVALAATFDPEVAEQGDTVEFTVFARGTDFLNGAPSLTFFDRYGENPDIVVDTVTVLDAENLYGEMTLSNAAALGDRDVMLSTGSEGVFMPEAFEVIGGGWSLEEVAISLSFTVVRSKDNDTGIVNESVQANCVFYIPLDPPCPSGGGGGSGEGQLGDPAPYDVNGVWGVTGEGSGGGEEDCPNETTISAGDYVWLESEANTITLLKNVDASSGAIFYSADGLTLEDYVPNNWYDLHTQGDPDYIGEYLLPAVQPTVPADWYWDTPDDLWGNHVHDRGEDFPFTWSSLTADGSSVPGAQTYPEAIFAVTLHTKNSPGPMAEEGWVGYAGVLPFDDGSHQFEADELSQLGAGTVPLHAYSFISGPEFGLPESIYQTNVASSYIYMLQSMVLE